MKNFLKTSNNGFNESWYYDLKGDAPKNYKNLPLGEKNPTRVVDQSIFNLKVEMGVES